MTAIFAGLVSFFKAVPILDSWAEQFVAYYVSIRIGDMKKENRDGIKAAVQKQDQRDLEKAIGSPLAGQASGIPGTTIVDQLPGVQK